MAIEHTWLHAKKYLSSLVTVQIQNTWNKPATLIAKPSHKSNRLYLDTRERCHFWACGQQDIFGWHFLLSSVIFVNRYFSRSWDTAKALYVCNLWVKLSLKLIMRSASTIKSNRYLRCWHKNNHCKTIFFRMIPITEITRTAQVGTKCIERKVNKKH